MLSRVILNRVTLSKALLNGHSKNTSSQAKKYTVDELIQLGYLTAYGNENEGYRIDTAQPLPMPIKDIKDFDAVFIGRSVPASVDTQRACMFNLSDKTHLTESQQKEIISKYNNKPNDRAISQLLFRNYTLPNADLKIIQNKTTDDSWQYSHKMFEGSTFNNVELNIKGSISSTNKLFMGITCNELEIYANSSSGNNMVAGTDVIAPHDTTEMYASSAINKYPRGVSYYRGLANWTFTNNWNGKATEIPNVRGVETEEERITSSINVMKLPSGILYQTLWITSITRIGPVLDVTNVTGSEYLWGNCGIQLPNVTDIRIKGLNNLDWDFRGGATDKAYIPKMDEDSIIYCLNNVVEQTDTTRNIYFSTEVIKPTYEENSARLKAALSNASTKGWNVYCGDTALIIPDTPPVGNYIQFEDKAVEAICVANWSSDGIGLTEEDAAAVTTIGSAFSQNTEITSFNEFRYFTGVTSIRADWNNAISSYKGAFAGCSNLRTIKLPASLVTLGQYSFYNCTSLTVDITDMLLNISVIGQYAFYNCPITGKVVMPNVSYIDRAQFYQTNISEVADMGKVTKLLGAQTGPFYNCDLMESITLPDTMTSIEGGSLYYCDKLTRIISRATTPPTIADWSFKGANIEVIYVPDASLEAYKTATNWNTYADRIHPLSEIEGSPYIQFADAEVERVLMSKGVSSDGVGITKEDAANVTSISTWFKGNTTIQTFDELQYFTGVTAIPYAAFDSAINLNSLDMSNIVTIGDYGLKKTNLNTIIAPRLQEIGLRALEASGVSKILNLGTLTSLPDRTFLNCDKLEVVILPNTLETIGTYAFSDIAASITMVSKASIHPTLTTTFTNSTITAIYVPDASVGDYQAATNWSTYASRIKGISQLATDNPTLYAEIQQYL